jgi:predicted Zn-dependent peptidase
LKDIKSGNFDGNLLKAIISNIKVMKIEERKSNDAIAYTMLDAFTLGRQWKEAVADLDAMATFTKKDVMDFAKAYFTNDRVVIYKRKGEDKSVTKIVKPEDNTCKM